ncbi:hypothetical protein [Leptospira ryugenii]|uniref:hypothetical protein n=1 Tax=Leptospira ryugenii TaxID=1917863 RepID=UPI000D593846|nr:hypothetical protein [Leptospira ryugenii]
MNKILKFSIVISLSLLAMVCQKKKETSCEDDVACSYLLLELTRSGSVAVSANTGALSNAGRYTVNVLRSADCSGTPVKTATFVDNTVSSNVTSTTFTNVSSGTYTVQATNGTISLCSGTFTIGALNSLGICRIATSSITCT